MNKENGLIVSDGGRDFIPAPEGDEHNAICVDAIHLGLTMTPFGEKDLVRIVWELTECPMEDGRPFIVNTRYTKSLHERSNLRKHLEKWRGKKFTEGELQGFDLDTIVGSCCRLEVKHSVSTKGKTYANVEGILKATKIVKASGKYTRVKDRDPKDQKPQHRMVDTSKEGNQSHPDDEHGPF